MTTHPSRGILALIVVLAAAAAVLAIGDVASFARLAPGSVGIPARADALERLPDEAACTSPRGCTARFAYAADETVAAWVTVRNDSPVPVTLEGVPASWLSLFQPQMLLRPVEILDGGDPTKGHASSTSTASFRPVLLGPGAERAIGVVFRSVADVPYACEHWAAGGGVAFEDLPVAWHWLATRHEARIPFARTLELMSPTAEDCASAGAGR